MSDKQKEKKVQNLLAAMKKSGDITRDSTNQQRSNWILTKK